MRDAPHNYRGAQLKAQVELFLDLDIVEPSCVKLPTAPVQAIKGLKLSAGYCCLSCGDGLTTSFAILRKYLYIKHQLEKRMIKEDTY